jgi:threonyl-tRNA synthetase
MSDMRKVTLPDGSQRTYDSEISAMDVAKDISEGLARNVLAAKVNGEVWDASRPLPAETLLQLLTWNDLDGKSTFWHSSAHLMAEALEALYPGIKLAIGPPIENGFYYDVDFGEHHFSSDDFPKVEAKMIELARQDNVYIRSEVSKKTPWHTSQKRKTHINWN